MSSIYLFCLVPVLFILAPWGFGSMVSAIARLRGLNPKRTFWISAVSYALLPIAAFLVAWLANDILKSYELSNAMLILTYLLAGFGVLIAPLIYLAVRIRNPDGLQKQIVSQPSRPSDLPMTPKPEPAVQKHESSPIETRIETKPGPAPVPVASPKVVESPSHIFVSYRRSDSADIAGRIYDRLIGKFGRGPIFKDVDSIPLGLDFKEYLDMKVGECDVLLAIIGDEWLTASDSAGNRRLDDPTDFVRIEIESALQRKIPVIPLLVRDAHMPREADLPASLHKLVYRNGTPIRSDPDFHRDMDRLIAALEKYMNKEGS